MIKRGFYIVVTAILLLGHNLFAMNGTDSLSQKKGEKKETNSKPFHKNVIKFNPTPMLLLGETYNITINYERMVARNQSVCIQLGYLIFPRISNDTVLNLIALAKGTKNGINLSLDYRYYPLSRNKRPAPDGLYIGGYLSYYGFKWHNTFDILHTSIDTKGDLDGNINILNLGFELGYQFIFWKRLTLDLLMFGPSLSYYNYKIKLDGGLDPEQIENIDQELVDQMLNRFPGLKEVFSSDGITGQNGGFNIGFRYAIMIGFHF
jgi:hypothetical protein